MNAAKTYDLIEWELRKLPNGNLADDRDPYGNTEWSPNQIGDEILAYLKDLTPGSYLVQIWTREHFEREFENVVLTKAAQEAAKNELQRS